MQQVGDKTKEKTLAEIERTVLYLLQFAEFEQLFLDFP